MEKGPQDRGPMYAGFDDDRELVHGDLEMKWKYFCGASLIVGAALLKAGAPPLTVIGGIALAVFLNFLRHHSNSAPNPLAAGKTTITFTQTTLNASKQSKHSF